jgi:Zn finger protein HypA/HybF involved in hydrogenase expression
MSVKEQSELKLDGNAIGGLLAEIFTMEMTTAQGKCAGCGAVNAIGRVDVYLNGPGAVVRCPDCTGVLMRIVHGKGRYWVDLSGLRVLELRDS